MVKQQPNKPPRFCVQAICTIKGSGLENQICRLWYGQSAASCRRAMKRLQEVHRSCYRDWQIANLASPAA
jgi:hypothetical protein